MYTETRVLDLLYRQTAPEIILEMLKRNLRGDPEDFLCPKDPKKNPQEYYEIENQPVADLRHFLDYADTTLRGHSQDEHTLLFDQLEQKRQRWEQRGISPGGCFLAPLIEFAEDHLQIIGGEPVCRVGKVLDWRDAYLRLGQDLLVCAFLAWEDYLTGQERKDFTWPVILRADQQDLYHILDKGMAENHNHLAGGTQSYQVTWTRMMNCPKMIREELVSFRTSNLYARMHRGEKYGTLDKFDILELAAVIRTILFRALHREEFSGQQPAYSVTGMEPGTEISPDTPGSTGSVPPPDSIFSGREAFAREYVESFSMLNNLEDTVDFLQTAYGVRFYICT